MSGQKIIQGLKEALDLAYGEQPDWCPSAVWAEARGWAEAHLSMQATGAASASLPVAIIAKAILSAKVEEREACALEADKATRVNRGIAAQRACYRIAAAIRKRGEE